MANIISLWFRTDEESWGPLVELDDGTMFPQWATASCVLLDPAVMVEVALGVEDGIPIVAWVTIKGSTNVETKVKTAPTQATVRAIPLDDIIHTAVVVATRRVAEESGQRPSSARVLRAYGHRGVTPDLLREVAAIVRGDLDGQPNKAVVARFGVSPRTASRWIKRAEQFITETED